MQLHPRHFIRFLLNARSNMDSFKMLETAYT